MKDSIVYRLTSSVHSATHIACVSQNLACVLNMKEFQAEKRAMCKKFQIERTDLEYDVIGMFAELSTLT